MSNQQLRQIANLGSTMKIDETKYIGKIFNSNKYGQYIIIEKLDYTVSKNTMVKIKFLISECEHDVTLSNALKGHVKDPQYGLNLNKIYYSDNYGPYKVLNIIKGKAKVPTKATIIFLMTNSIITTFLKHVIDGDVCDPYAKCKTPIDTHVLTEYEYNKRIDRLLRSMWYYMNKRCYNKNADNYDSYGKLGIKVCERWKDINNFVEDAKYLPQFDKWSRFPTLYQLDKDYLQLNLPKNQRIYSPETCMFLYYKDNINLRAIEFRNSKEQLLSSKFYGITKESNNSYSAHMIINNNSIYLGTFSDEIVAANVYNYWYNYYHEFELVPLLNDVPFIDPSEFIKYNTRPKKMCKLVEERNKICNL